MFTVRSVPLNFFFISDLLQTAACFIFITYEVTPKSAPSEIQKRNALFIGVPVSLLTLAVSVIYIKLNMAVFHQVSLKFKFPAKILIDTTSFVVRSITILKNIFRKSFRNSNKFRRNCRSNSVQPIEISTKFRDFWQVMYGAMALGSALRSMYLQRFYDHGQARDAELKRKISKIRKIHLIGALMFVLGFVLWNIDNIFCEQLRAARKKMGEWEISTWGSSSFFEENRGEKCDIMGVFMTSWR